jgi:lipoprotein signal peptidase
VISTTPTRAPSQIARLNRAPPGPITQAMASVPPPSRLAAPVVPAPARRAFQEGAQLALTTAIVASTVSFAVHAFGIPHQMHTGKSVGPALLYLVLTVGWTLLRRRRSFTGLTAWGLAVFAGGSVANLAEAVLFGGVTDFLPLHAGALTMLFSAGDLAVLAGTAASLVAALRRRGA